MRAIKEKIRPGGHDACTGHESKTSREKVLRIKETMLARDTTAGEEMRSPRHDACMGHKSKKGRDKASETKRLNRT